ncbi:MAG: TonB-dependent receptor [Chitinophagaceae bacterium]
MIFLLKKMGNKIIPCLTAIFLFASLTGLAFKHQKAAAPITISGKVVSKDGRSIEGATVQVKGTQQGTTSKADGTFELRDVNSEASVLVISSVGYQTQELAIGTKTNFNIVLVETASGLEDVVVVGYGNRRKSDLTGSVATVSADNLKERAVVNFGEAMAGQLAGVQVQQINGAPGGEGLSIKVRGTGSITQSNSPLYVVDGYPMEDGAFRLINPNDIESLQVLKDASSTAIYGSRGANGVVIITTKKGRSGTTSISFNAFSGVQERTRTIPVMSRDQYVKWFIDGRNQAWLDQAVINADPDKSPHTINDPNSRRMPYPSSNSLYMIPDGKNGYTYNFLDPQSVAQMPDNNWQDLLFRRAQMQQYELSVMGGSEKTTYAFSGSYMKQAGISLNTDYQRFNFRNNVESKLSSRFKIGLNLNAYYATGHEQANGKDAPILYSLLLPPIFNLHNEDGTYGSMVRNSEVLAGDVANPIGIAQQVQRRRNRYGWLGTLYAELDVIDNLKYRISINGSIQNNNYETFEPSTVDFDGSKGPRPAKGINEKSTDFDWVIEQTLSYTKTLGQKHDMVLLGGFSSQKHNNDNIYAESRGFPNDNIQTLNAGTMYQLSSTKSGYSMISYFGRANYTYDNRYLLTATVRSDGSSRFGANKKWGVFPSVSAAWRLSQESFMTKLSQTVNDLKLRVSYGIAGNNRIGNYSSIGLLASGYYPTGDGLQNTVNPSTVPNSDLGWEKVLQSNIGFDLGLFNNRIRLEGDFYSSKSIDLLLNVPVPTVTGYSTQIQNIGKVLNKGIEFLLTTKNLTGALKWSSNFNIAFNKNKVLEVGPGGQPIYASAPNANNSFITKPGYPIASFYGYVYQGVFMSQKDLDNNPHLPADKVGDGRYLDVNQDGKLDQTDKAIIGNNHPKFTGGFTNNFSYGNFSLSAQLSYSYGAQLFSFFKRMVGIYHGDRNTLIEQEKRWRSIDQPGDGVHFRATRNPTGWQRDPSSAWVTDGSFLRLRNVTLAYDFNQSKIRALRISGLRFYATGQNLFTWTDYPGFDPETSSEGDGLARGGDYMGYPAARSIIVGLNVSL